MITKLRSEPGNQVSEKEMTELFGVSRSGYRHHLSDPITKSRKRKIEIVAEMKEIHKDEELKTYGSPRMTDELKERGHSLCENTTAKWMREESLVAKGSKPFKPPKTTTPDPQAKYSPNLLKDKTPTRLGEMLISDITYIRTKEGWMYLAVVLDLHSRAVLGWQLEKRMPAKLVVRALQEAMGNWSIDPTKAIFHSDRGSQYTSKKLRNQLARYKITQSMSGTGNCYDNATCESFFSSLKREMMPECGYFENAFHARTTIFKHIEGFYNTRRKHTSLGMKSPFQFLKETEENALAA